MFKMRLFCYSAAELPEVIRKGFEPLTHRLIVVEQHDVRATAYNRLLLPYCGAIQKPSPGLPVRVLFHLPVKEALERDALQPAAGGLGKPPRGCSASSFLMDGQVRVELTSSASVVRRFVRLSYRPF